MFIYCNWISTQWQCSNMLYFLITSHEGLTQWEATLFNVLIWCVFETPCTDIETLS